MDKHTEASMDQPPSYQPGPMAQPATGTPQPTYVIAQAGLPEQLHPHNFLVFSITVAALCGFFDFLTLLLSIPAVVMSGLHHDINSKEEGLARWTKLPLSLQSSKQGSYSRAKIYGNTAAGLSLSALVAGSLIVFIGVLLGVYYITWIQCRSGGCNGQNIHGLPR